MPEAITLYHGLGACSTVTLRALDKAGLAYDVHQLSLANGEQRSEAYLSINPSGRVPALRVGDRVLTENVAILLYLDESNPAAGLLPATDDPILAAQVRAEMLWCCATLHPAIRQIRGPARYTNGGTGPVLEKGLETFATLAAYADARLAATGHWIGDKWSILDTYVAWGFAAGGPAGFDPTPFPDLAKLIDVEDPMKQRQPA